MVTIISTHPTSVRYNMWNEDPKTHSKYRVWDCTIKGGAGVAQNKGTLYTPTGVATEISEEALEKLNKIPCFVADVEAGLIKVLKNTKARTVDADEEALKDMDTETNGKQITDTELEADGAEINSDGSIDVSGGGKNVAVKRNNNSSSAKIKSLPKMRKSRKG